MALSLALGLGLQGAPKDYVDVYMARQKGKAAAEQKAAEAKAKKLDPYLQRMYRAMGDVVLPKDENLLFEEQADALKTAEGGDLNLTTQAFSKLMANAAKAKSDYNLVTKIEGYRGADGTTEEILNDIKNTPDRAELATKLNSNPLSTLNVGPDGQLIYNGFKRVDVTKDIFQTLNQSAFYDPTAQTPIKFGEKNYIAIGLKPEAAQMLTQKFSSPDFKRSVYAEYGEKLQQLNTPPDFSTPAGVETFKKGAEDFLATKVQEQFPLFSKLVPADMGKGTTIINQMPGAPEDLGSGIAESSVIVGPFDETVDIVGYSPKDVTATLSNSGETFNLKTNSRISNAGVVKGTYNTIAAVYTAGKDIKIPSSFFKQFGVDRPDLTLPKGAIISNPQLQTYLKEQGDLSANFIAIGRDENTKVPIYRAAKELTATQRGALPKADKERYDAALERLNEFRKNVNSRGSAAKPAAAATKLAAPKVKTIKSSDIPAKAKASGKSVDEYTKLLKQNGITITN
jgi:hypothetical protein